MQGMYNELPPPTEAISIALTKPELSIAHHQMGFIPLKGHLAPSYLSQEYV